MTKDKKKKHNKTRIVFLIWALTAVILFANAYISYRSVADFFNFNMQNVWRRSTETELSADGTAKPALPQRQEEEKQMLEQRRDRELLRTIIVAVYVLTAAIIYLRVKEKRNVLTVIYTVLIFANLILWITHPVLYYH